MDAEDIKIGFWYRKIHGKGFTDLEMTLELMAKIFDPKGSVAFNDFQGIPISKECLVEFGAKQYLDKIYFPLTTLRAELHLEFYKEVVVPTINSNFTHGLILNEIKYLHEFQFLYNVLSNEKLSIK